MTHTPAATTNRDAELLDDGTAATGGLPVASRQDGTYPRPQLMRSAWRDLGGVWAFRHDDDDVGIDEDWMSGLPGVGTILVPFPPESSASGVEEPGFHPIVWYQRAITPDDLTAAGRSAECPRLLLHFGAVDYRARIYLDGRFVGEHEGGQTPFRFDITDLADDGLSHELVVRAEDDPHDVAQPRGKQDWHESPHAIWYRRTTGIWQTVWLEAVPATWIDHLRWIHRDVSTVTASLVLEGSVDHLLIAEVRLWLEDSAELLGDATVTIPANSNRVNVTIPIPRLSNGQAQDEVWWSPEHPRLVDATVTVHRVQPGVAPFAVDSVSSYLGLRRVGVARGAFLLNGLPYDVRSVLNQGYWPASHVAAPSYAALRTEVELIKELGFNATRIHQKIEDPRFLFWADRLGLLVWAEAPGAYEFSPTAVRRLISEWMAALERDVSHPSIVTWVPMNESWGVQQIADDPAEQALSRALADVTRALDPSRPVISNDGWEHQNSDIITVHDYEGDGQILARTYADSDARARLFTGMGPAGRRLLVGGAADRKQPVMLTEFGGVAYQPGPPRDDAWGYTSAQDDDAWIGRITALYDAVRASEFLAGSCYTQLTDTMQETNGLLTADRLPKVPIKRIRAAVTGCETTSGSS